MTLDEIKKRQQRCVKALDDLGASQALRKFCLDVVEYEEETVGSTLRLHQKLQEIDPKDSDSLDLLRRLIQTMTNDFKNWNRTVDALIQSGSTLPPLRAGKWKNKTIKAQSSIQTNQLEISEGESLTVIETEHDNRIKVRTLDLKEDFIPILVCILQSSDKTVPSLLQRLLVQLLSSWSDCLKLSGKVLLMSTRKAFQLLKLSESDLSEVELNGSSMITKIKQLQEITRRLEKDYSKPTTTGGGGGKDRGKSKEIVANLTKLLSSYQTFFDHWNNFRLQLKGRKPLPIYVIEKLEDFKEYAADKEMKCYTTTFTVQSTEIREEVTHIPNNDLDDDVSSCGGGGGGHWKQSVEAEQLTSTSHEEKQRYIIRAVKDPRTAEKISLQTAIELGIIDMTKGLFFNPDTKETKPIVLALNEGLIQVEYVTKTRSNPKTEALGLITIRDRVESRKYTIVAAVDARTAEKVELMEAKKRGLIDDGATCFHVSTSGEKLSMEDAIDSGWVLVEFDSEDEEPQETRTRTYAIRAVVDQRHKKRVPFIEAVQRRLIDRDTGNYINNLTGETIYVVDAINRGFLKAKLIDDPSKINIDPHNRMVVDSIHKMKSLVTGLTALASMKESVSRSSTGSISDA